MTTSLFEPGARLGKYRLIEPLGQGGMGDVWDVEDDAGNHYALKSPASGMNQSPEITKRFAREANAVGLLDHPNLVAAVEVFVEAGHLCLVMERVVGRTLARLVAAGPVPVRNALVIVRQILEGVGHAHERGLIHRDLKPENVMLVDMGGWERAKVVDFGVVKLIGDAEAAMGGGKLTTTGLVFGTPMYMSPEQAMGKAVDGRSDLYALGTILFELLTGRVPFDHTDPMIVMRMQVKTPPPRLDSVVGAQSWCTPELVAMLEGALMKDPDHRFPSAAAMMAALDHAFVSLDPVA